MSTFRYGRLQEAPDQGQGEVKLPAQLLYAGDEAPEAPAAAEEAGQVNKVRAQMVFGLLVILACGAAIGYANIPQNTFRQGAGGVMPTFNATAGYYVGVNQIVSAGRAAQFVTLDTGQGDNEIYDMDQNVLTTSGPTFATVHTGEGANELFPMDQGVRSTADVVFTRVDL